MKRKTLLALAGLCGAMILSPPADASFTGLEVYDVTASAAGPAPAGGQRIIFHVYANFSDPNDRVNAWYGNQANPMSIRNVLDDFSAGAGFTQVGGGGGQLAPYSAGTTRDWDTYATLGVRYGNQAPGGADASTLSPGAPVFINSTTLNTNNFAAFVTPDAAQGRAGFINSGFDTAHRVLLMQLVVLAGEGVAGTINIDGQLANGVNFTASDQQFIGFPAPGAAVLLLAGSIPGGRRRLK